MDLDVSHLKDHDVHLIKVKGEARLLLRFPTRELP
jgi:hypothetical protein